MVKKFRGAFLVMIAAATVIAPSGALATDGGDAPGCERELEAASHAFDQSFIDREFDAFMAFVAADAVQIDYLGHVYLGKGAIADFTRLVMRNQYTFTHSLISQTVRPCSSASVLQDTVFAIPSRGLSIHLLDAVNWARVEGEWKVVMIQNTEIPDPAA